ncbi:MAG: sodium transport system ATP-binding protein [Myxococcota bacterium]|jgi:sodium transport system ATP-binding protein
MEQPENSTPPAVQLIDLTRDFGALRAVDRVSLQVQHGEIYGLLGPNGAGKTTSIRMLAGLLTPSSGTAEVLGVNPADDPKAVKGALGYLTGDTALYGRLTPREILRFFGTLNGKKADWIGLRIEELSEELGLGEFIDRRCEKLSSGQKQRTAIARALVHDPDVLVLDEPTATLDVLSAQFILDRLTVEAERGKAVLLSTHHLPEAELICHRIGIIHRGRLIAEDTAQNLRAQTGSDNLTAAFLALISAAEAESDVAEQSKAGADT